MSLDVIRYPLDPTGTSPDNLVDSEPHVLPNRTVRAVALGYGAFFTESVQVRDSATNQLLTKGVQYYPAELYELPSARYGKEICSIIVITDTSVSNNIKVTYQALGGEFSRNVQAVVQQIDKLMLDNRPISWPSIIDKPDEFNPAHHLHDIGDVYGFEYLVHATNRVRQAIETGDSASHDQIYRYIDQLETDLIARINQGDQAATNHITNTSNPHNTTAAQVGAYSIAQSDTIINPIKTKVDNHVANVANPHNTTAAQVGAYLKAEVDNLISTLQTTLTNNLNTHINNKSNPHNVTAAQLNVYIKSEVDTLVNNLSTALNNKIDAHTARTNNPHSTTAAQVGAYTIAQTDAAIAPVNTKIDNHVARVDNPHNTTAAQVGAYTIAQTNAAIAPVNTKIDNHTARTDNPHGVTAAQVGAPTTAQMNTAIAVVQTNLNTHTANTSNPHNTTAAQVGAYTIAQTDAAVNSAKQLTNDHAARTDNPHNTTKAQVGLGSVVNWPIATDAEADNYQTNHYMTPSLTKRVAAKYLTENITLRTPSNTYPEGPKYKDPDSGAWYAFADLKKTISASDPGSAFGYQPGHLWFKYES